MTPREKVFAAVLVAALFALIGVMTVFSATQAF